MPQPGLLGKLIDAMRTTPCGGGGLQRHFSTVSLQAFRFACALLGTRAVAAFPRAKGNKKSAVTPYPPCPGLWPTAPSVDSVKFDYKYQRPSVVNSLLRAESDITAQTLAYSRFADIVKLLLCYLSEIFIRIEFPSWDILIKPCHNILSVSGYFRRLNAGCIQV